MQKLKPYQILLTSCPQFNYIMQDSEGEWFLMRNSPRFIPSFEDSYIEYASSRSIGFLVLDYEGSTQDSLLSRKEAEQIALNQGRSSVPEQTNASSLPPTFEEWKNKENLK